MKFVQFSNISRTQVAICPNMEELTESPELEGLDGGVITLGSTSVVVDLKVNDINYLKLTA